jgi:hypothetical protein
MRNGLYELVVAPAAYPGKRYRGRYVYEHQLVWWEHTGTIVPSNFVIHHKDENKRNNVFSNLEKVERGSHVTFHHKPAASIVMRCSWCGSNFDLSLRNWKSKSKAGQRHFYCSRSHAVRGQHNGVLK